MVAARTLMCVKGGRLVEGKEQADHRANLWEYRGLVIGLGHVSVLYQWRLDTTFQSMATQHQSIYNNSGKSLTDLCVWLQTKVHIPGEYKWCKEVIRAGIHIGKSRRQANYGATTWYNWQWVKNSANSIWLWMVVGCGECLKIRC